MGTSNNVQISTHKSVLRKVICVILALTLFLTTIPKPIFASITASQSFNAIHELFVQGRFLDAEKLVDGLYDKYKFDTEFLFNAAFVYAAMNRDCEAVEAFGTVVLKDKGRGERALSSILNLGKLYHKLGDYNKAL